MIEVCPKCGYRDTPEAQAQRDREAREREAIVAIFVSRRRNNVYKTEADAIKAAVALYPRQPWLASAAMEGWRSAS